MLAVCILSHSLRHLHQHTKSCQRSLYLITFSLPLLNAPLATALDNTQIDEANAFGNTALHVACFNGQDAVVSELIDYGANVSQPNNKGFTPLHFAAASTHGALCLEFLVNNGADVNVQVGEMPACVCHLRHGC